jgi:hypothetical protein
LEVGGEDPSEDEGELSGRSLSIDRLVLSGEGERRKYEMGAEGPVAGGDGSGLGDLLSAVGCV